VQARILSIHTFGIMAMLEQVSGGLSEGAARRRALTGLKDLDLKGMVHVGEVSDFNVKKREDIVSMMQEQYSEGDKIRALITSVDPEKERINLSFRSSRISSVQNSGLLDRLGSVSDGSASDEGETSELEEKQTRGGIAAKDRGRVGAYLEQLVTEKAFLNPSCVAAMMRAYGIGDEDGSRDEYCGLLTDFSCSPGDEYEVLRRQQNKGWALESVKQGIAYAKEGLYEKAMASYGHALEVDPQNADAHVARGAAYANQNLLEAAGHEFDAALKVEPEHPNAAKYREATKAKLKARLEVAAESIKPRPPPDPLQEMVERDVEVDGKLKALLKEDRKRKKREKKTKKKKKKNKEKKSKKKKDKKKDAESSSSGSSDEDAGEPSASQNEEENLAKEKGEAQQGKRPKLPFTYYGA